MVAMNPQTWDADLREIEPGGHLFYDNTRPLPPSKFREDIRVIRMPLTEIGLAYVAEIPATIIHVQRGGPTIGMPTRTQPSVVIACAYASHGDTNHLMLFTEDPHECFEHAAAALGLADRLQTPVYLAVSSDGDSASLELGQFAHVMLRGVSMV